ncbi:MAG: hypothetical protein DI535_00910 [Citrobacter freundii]|nr:MAG: hypothetical protein DI535_00910 [Citrobacter freundii]
MKQQFTERHQNLCTYTGVFGALIAATSLIQLLKYTNSHWMAYVLLSVYSFGVAAFILLAVQKTYSPVLIIISTALSMITVAFITITGFYSPILILHFLYGVAICVVLYMENIPRFLKTQALLKREEAMEWRDKL